MIHRAESWTASMILWICTETDLALEVSTSNAVGCKCQEVSECLLWHTRNPKLFHLKYLEKKKEKQAYWSKMLILGFLPVFVRKKTFLKPEFQSSFCILLRPKALFLVDLGQNCHNLNQEYDMLFSLYLQPRFQFPWPQNSYPKESQRSSWGLSDIIGNVTSQP